MNDSESKLMVKGKWNLLLKVAIGLCVLIGFSQCGSDELDELIIVQSWASSVSIPVGTQPAKGIIVTSGKIENNTAYILQQNGLTTADVGAVRAKSIEISFSSSTGFKPDSSMRWQVGIMDGARHIVLGEIDTLASGQDNSVNLRPMGVDIKEQLFTQDSVQLFYVFSLTDSVSAAKTPTITIEYQFSE